MEPAIFNAALRDVWHVTDVLSKYSHMHGRGGMEPETINHLTFGTINY